MAAPASVSMLRERVWQRSDSLDVSSCQRVSLTFSPLGGKSRDLVRYLTI